MPAKPGVLTSLSSRPSGIVATLTVSNPGRLNSLNTKVLTAFISALSSLAQTPYLRCVIITGAPCLGNAQAFSGGADISELSSFTHAAAGREFITRLHLACKAIRDLPVPVVARVNGHALGAGLLLMAAADLRITTSDSTFGMPEVRRGVPSTVESAELPSIVGAGRARRLLILGDNISALTAESWGLVDRVVEPAGLDNAVEEWVQQLLEAGPSALAGQKRLMNVWEQVPLQEAVTAGVWEFGKAFEDEGTKEAEGTKMMNAFLKQNRDRKSKL